MIEGKLYDLYSVDYNNWSNWKFILFQATCRPSSYFVYIDKTQFIGFDVLTAR